MWSYTQTVVLTSGRLWPASRPWPPWQLVRLHRVPHGDEFLAVGERERHAHPPLIDPLMHASARHAESVGNLRHGEEIGGGHVVRLAHTCVRQILDCLQKRFGVGQRTYISESG